MFFWWDCEKLSFLFIIIVPLDSWRKKKIVFQSKNDLWVAILSINCLLSPINTYRLSYCRSVLFQIMICWHSTLFQVVYTLWNRILISWVLWCFLLAVCLRLFERMEGDRFEMLNNTSLVIQEFIYPWIGFFSFPFASVLSKSWQIEWERNLPITFMFLIQNIALKKNWNVIWYSDTCTKGVKSLFMNEIIYILCFLD